MKLPEYNYRTGNPRYDNRSRALNRKNRLALRNVRFKTPKGRKRKKELTKIEGANYIVLINEVMLDLWKRDHESAA